MSTPSYLRYANQGATRNLPLDPRLASALGFLGEMGVTAEVYSGGQPAKGTSSRRVGSTRHDNGNAGDFRFYREGRQLDWASEGDRPVFEDIVRRGRAAGITGFGAGPGYMGAGTMHVGFGAPGVWGAGGRGANAPEWLRSAYYGAAGETGAMARAPSAPGGASGALETALLDRGTAGPSLPSSATAYASDGASPMSRPMMNIGPEKSNKLAEAMIARASADAGNMTHPLQLLGNLAQVWSGNQQIRANDKANQDELEKALMGSGLDPAYAMAAQIGGGRDDLASALLAQQSDRSQAANRAEDQAWRQQQFDYQAGQDAMANNRADQALDLQRERANQPPDAPSGYQWANGGLQPIPGGPADGSGQPGFRPASAGEAARYGAPAGQFGPDGRFYPNNPPSGMSVEVGPNGTTRIVQGPGAGAGGSLTEGQSKDAVFSTRARGALPLIDQFGEALTNPIAQGASGLPGGNYMVGEGFQRGQQAGNEFLQAILRKDTGAAITTQEVVEYGSVYLPRPGDSPATLQQKQQSRQRALAAIEAGMPPAAILQQERALIQSGTPEVIQQRDENGVPVGGMGGGPAPTDQGTTTQRAKNPQTGEVLELRNGQWVSIQ